MCCGFYKGCFVALYTLPFTDRALAVHGKQQLQLLRFEQKAGAAASELTHASNRGSALQELIYPKVFCFAFTISRNQDLELLPEVAKQLGQCSGYQIFTDFVTNDTQFVDVHLTKIVDTQLGDIQHANNHYLNQNMIGLWPAWDWILRNVEVSEYDWFVNVELDHFTRPSLLRQALAATEPSLINASGGPQVGSCMLIWGNVFLFSRQMVGDMKRQWPRLKKIEPADSLGRLGDLATKPTLASGHASPGCPEWMNAQIAFWPGCSQDVAYNVLVNIMDPAPKKFRPAVTQDALMDNCTQVYIDLITVNKSDSDVNTSVRFFEELVARKPKILMTSPNFVDDRSYKHAFEHYHQTLRSRLEVERDRLEGEALEEPYRFDEHITKILSIRKMHAIEMLREVNMELEQQHARMDICRSKGVPEPVASDTVFFHHVKYRAAHVRARELLGL